MDPPGWTTPLRGFPKKNGNKNAIISENSTWKIDPPPFQNLALCSNDPPEWKKSHAHVCIAHTKVYFIPLKKMLFQFWLPFFWKLSKSLTYPFIFAIVYYILLRAKVKTLSEVKLPQQPRDIKKTPSYFIDLHSY